mmetsp:Transcript_10400/g.12817  ORF Transcript_10400/g.12817 Transcript_10400/m.12817 type:complete len:167 (-) Transcript_10400:35-535(-)
MLRRTLIATHPETLLARPATAYGRTFCSRNTEWEKAKDSSKPMGERAKAAFESGKEAIKDMASATKEKVQDATQTMKNSSSDTANQAKNKASEYSQDAKNMARDAKETAKEYAGDAKSAKDSVMNDSDVNAEANKAKNADTWSGSAEHAKNATKEAYNKAKQQVKE